MSRYWLKLNDLKAWRLSMAGCTKDDEVKACESCGRELTEHHLDQNYLLINTPFLCCPQCYPIRDLIIKGPDQ